MNSFKYKLRHKLISFIDSADAACVSLCLKAFGETNALLLFLFHNVFLSQKEIDRKVNLPQEGFTVDDYRQFIEYFLEKNYQFVSTKDIMNGLKANKKYICITFDDGYFNNSHFLPLMKEYQIPTAFYISSNEVLQSRNYWWNSLYRERQKQGIDRDKINAELSILDRKKREEIERYMVQEFGGDIWLSASDVDRPFSTKELQEFAKEELVHIGNHTADHSILTTLTASEIRSQLTMAQNTLKEITGVFPNTFAYPNGKYSELTTQILDELGFKLGITCDFGKNKIPLNRDPNNLLKLKRFHFWGKQHWKTQCQRFRCEASPYLIAKKLNQRLSMRGSRA